MEKYGESLEKDNSFISTSILIDNTDVYFAGTSLRASQNLKWPSKNDFSEHSSTHPVLLKKNV